MGRTADISRLWGIGLILACLALGLRLVVPAGFMPGVGVDGRAALVICTAGPGDAPGKTDKEQGRHAGDQSSVCAFAGQGAAPAPEMLAAPQAAFVGYAPAPRPRFADVAPGRGLPAPPPPSRGPPLQLA